MASILYLILQILVLMCFFDTRFNDNFRFENFNIKTDKIQLLNLNYKLSLIL